MIDINDYNREDVIASCLMEAAQVMSESADKKEGLYDKVKGAIKTISEKIIKICRIIKEK